MSENSWYLNGRLPPVGSKCIFTGFPENDCLHYERSAKGQEVKIVCHFNAQCCQVAGFIFYGDHGEVFIAQSKRDYFKPIKTDRDIAIEEMAELISCSPFNGAITVSEILYDAGYRKTTPN